jgi:hypothetical protein
MKNQQKPNHGRPRRCSLSLREKPVQAALAAHLSITLKQIYGAEIPAAGLIALIAIFATSTDTALDSERIKEERELADKLGLGMEGLPRRIRNP